MLLLDQVPDITLAIENSVSVIADRPDTSHAETQWDRRC